MTITLDKDNSCWYESPEGAEHSSISRVEIITDQASQKTMALMNGLRIVIEPTEADALIAAGARDGRQPPHQNP